MSGATKTKLSERKFDRPPEGKSEQRREPRYLPNRLVEILPCGSGTRDRWEFRPAELSDCSSSGVGLLTDAPMQPGERFILKIKLVKWVLLHYTVRYCAASALRGQYRIGAELIGYVDASQHHDPGEVLAAMIEHSHGSDGEPSAN